MKLDTHQWNHGISNIPPKLGTIYPHNCKRIESQTCFKNCFSHLIKSQFHKLIEFDMRSNILKHVTIKGSYHMELKNMNLVCIGYIHIAWTKSPTTRRIMTDDSQLFKTTETEKKELSNPSFQTRRMPNLIYLLAKFLLIHHK